MSDPKLGIVDLGLHIEGIAFMSIVKLFQQTLVSSLRKTTLFIQQVENSKFLYIVIQIVIIYVTLKTEPAILSPNGDQSITM